MRFRNKRDGKIYRIVRQSDGWDHDDDEIVFYAVPEDDKYGGHIFSYPSIKALSEEWEDQIDTTYAAMVKDVLRRYMWEVDYEGHMIYKATDGDGRKYQTESHEHMGRLNAVRDIARALGVAIEPVCEFFPDNEYNYKLHDDKFYPYGFEWKRKMYDEDKKGDK